MLSAPEGSWVPSLGLGHFLGASSKVCCVEEKNPPSKREPDLQLENLGC